MSIIIGIDHGYYAIKTAHCSFPAGLTSYGEHEPYTRQGLLEFGGCFFVCGSGRQPIQRDKTVNDNYYLLTLVAIATKEIAKALNVREENFFTRAETPEDIIRTLIWYDWEHGCSGCVPIDIVLLFDDFDEVGDFLKEWSKQKKKLKARKITRAKYLEWMLQWPTVKENN